MMVCFFQNLKHFLKQARVDLENILIHLETSADFFFKKKYDFCLIDQTVVKYNTIKMNEVFLLETYVR